MMFLQLAPHQQIKFLIGAAEFEVGFQRHGIVALHQRIHEFMDRYRLVAFVAFGKIVAFEHARYRVCGGEFNHVRRVHFVHPRRIKRDFSFVAVEYLEYLLGVGLRVARHVFARQRRARGVFTGGVANHAGKVADEEQNVMAEVL